MQPRPTQIFSTKSKMLKVKNTEIPTQIYSAKLNVKSCTVYLCWTRLHYSCWSLNISAFSNNLTINQFYLFFLPTTLSFTHTLPPHLTHYFSGDLGTLSLGIPYHTCNTTKAARETTFFCFSQSILKEREGDARKLITLCSGNDFTKRNCYVHSEVPHCLINLVI